MVVAEEELVGLSIGEDEEDVLNLFVDHPQIEFCLVTVSPQYDVDMVHTGEDIPLTKVKALKRQRTSSTPTLSEKSDSDGDQIVLWVGLGSKAVRQP
ncbi:hypothetical protein V6N11_079876 [Hibiscus sabdariffa]|uniref:Uncharacterized protein n=1 Tax=Hibiscus sabdariffa TaxID=183260 RepID=A0ABR2RWN6_9ROSI